MLPVMKTASLNSAKSAHGHDRFTTARIGQTRAAIERVQNLAERLIEMGSDVPAVQGSIDKAIRELNGILLDIRVSRVTGGQPDVGAQVHMLTNAAAAIVEALATALQSMLSSLPAPSARPEA